MAEQEETLLRERLPKFTDAEAARLFYEHGGIVSLDGREGPMGSFLVSFVSEKGLVAGPLVLNSTVARRLCGLLMAAGYGPPA